MCRSRASPPGAKGVSPDKGELSGKGGLSGKGEVSGEGRFCAGALQKVLMKVAFRNPGLRLTNVLRTLPPDADLEELKALVATIVDKVSGIKRIEGDRAD